MFTPNYQKLVKKSASVVDVFTKTQKDLTEINDEILAEQEARNAEIQRLLAENSELETTKKANAKIIGKIDAFLNEE